MLHVKLIQEAHFRAVNILHERSTPYGFRASAQAAGYPQIWARDSAITFLGAVCTGNENLIRAGRASLETLGRHQSRRGLIPLNVNPDTGYVSTENAGAVDSNLWFILAHPVVGILFYTCILAEANRAPFDNAEAEQELVGGYHTEYSGMKLMLLLVSEYLHMFLASVLLVVLFLGGWHLWGVTGAGEHVGWLEAVLRVGVLLAKVVAVVFFFMLARWSWPRFRFDQLMALAWKVLVPLAMVQLVAVAVWAEYGARIADSLGISPGWTTVALGWTVLLAAGAAAVVSAPPAADNRPRLPVGEG